MEELAEAQRRTEQRVEELAEAQRRTEQRLEELAEAQQRTEQRVEELAEAQRRTEQRVEELAEAQRRTEEQMRQLVERQQQLEGRMDRLEIAMRELAESQRQTDQKMRELAESQRQTDQKMQELAEAQKRTEQRLEELAEAQQRTEEEMRGLTVAMKEMRRTVGTLQHTVGYMLEDRACAGLPALLKADFGIEVVGRLTRDCVKVGKRDVEVNIFGKGWKDGAEVWIVGEAKTQVYERDVKRFERTVEELKTVLGENLFLVMVGYQIAPGAQQYLRARGIAFYLSTALPL